MSADVRIPRGHGGWEARSYIRLALGRRYLEFGVSVCGTPRFLAGVVGGRGSSPRFAKISNALFDPKKCSDMFNSLT